MPGRDLIDRVRKALAERYTVVTAVGRGGNACIFAATDRTGEQVAIKVLHPELAVSVAADRFLREIRYASQLHHPHIAPLLDSGETEYLLWFVARSEEHTSELQSRLHLVCRLLLEKKKDRFAEISDFLSVCTNDLTQY